MKRKKGFIAADLSGEALVSVDNVDWSVRTFNFLMKARDIKTLHDIATLSDQELRDRRCAWASIREMREVLHNLNLLADPPVEIVSMAMAWVAYP